MALAVLLAIHIYPIGAGFQEKKVQVAIDVQAMTKQFGHFVALDDVSP